MVQFAESLDNMANIHTAILLLLLCSQLSDAKFCWKKIGGFVAGTAATAVMGPIALAGMGFTAAGIAGGSLGAAMMSSGLPVAGLQSAGAAGLSHSTMAAGGALTAWFFDCD
ncbi:interferon alpha-inducible protein 27-like protein 2A [Biomphalaria glabrata]|uniref:Interferon alpha-inducible protein 27-like protein 2A n=1 Tax=Biomphalaria glabrata TaxID=6526 RepID=A0A9W3BF75_BIOGL|nr:interferon alpha-inducible protein 27-like protein 2A [Biomphalaria glabrata]